MPTDSKPVVQRGAESFLFPSGPVGCLLLHGFTAAPQEVLRLGAHLASHGYTALGMRLAGHGTEVDDLARTRWPDWLASAEDGYDLLQGMCERIVLMGTSTGGLLSVLLAVARNPAGIVLMSMPMALPEHPLMRWAKLLGLVWPRVAKGPPDWFDPSAGAERVMYPAYPTRGVPEMQELIAQARAALPRITIPALVIHSRQDTFIVPRNAELTLSRLGSRDKHLLFVEHSNHLITLDAARQVVFDAALDFTRRVTKVPR